MAFLILAIIIIIALYFFGSRWVCGPSFDEVHYVPVSDDRNIVMHRLRPAAGKTKRKFPIILCHGLGANRFNLALPGRYSFAEMFRQEGYDVFCLELSGFGMSVPGRWGTPGRWDVVFDDFVYRDGPAAIDRVLAETGAKKSFWIGHSMGGMTAYALAQTDLAKKIRGVVTISSPGTFRGMEAFKPFLKFAPILKYIPRLNLGLYFRIFAPIAEYLPGLRFLKMAQMGNIDSDTKKLAAANVISTIPSSLLLQFGRWLETGQCTSEEGYDFQENLHRVKIPFLTLAGGGDDLVHPEMVKFAYDGMSSKDKTYHCFSKANGGLADYGHGDIIFGRTAPGEVHSMVRDWVNER
jgi:pimeloyl-ACP methyl ester carboxylesterase